MLCAVCGTLVEIEEPNPTDLGCFVCDECIEAADDLDQAAPEPNGDHDGR